MFESVSKLEAKVKKLEEEVKKHKLAMQAAKPEDKFVHRERMNGANEELTRTRAKLIKAKAKDSLKKKKGK